MTLKLILIPLTEEAFEVLRTAMIRPVCVLQVPDSPLLARQEVFDLKPCGGVAAGLGAEPGGDFEAAVRHRVVAWAKSRPVPEALFSAALLEEENDAERSVQGGDEK